MAKIGAMMDVGKRSLSNAQTSLQTVAHNIANKSTEGFSRQRVETMTNTPVSEGNLQIGMGARAGVVTRVNNPWLEKQIQRETTGNGYQDTKSNALQRVEQVFNEQQNKGLNQYVTEFFNAFRELSNTPESIASRTMVREAAGAMTKDFKRVVTQLTDVQNDLDGQLRTLTNEVNQIAKEIASLNEKVQLVEVQGVPANDERDRRDLLIKKLSEKVDISWAEGDFGMVAITAGKTGLLVSGTSANEFEARTSGDSNKVDIYFKAGEGKTPQLMTKQISGGRMGAALEVRDQIIEDQLANVDRMAFTLANEVNDAHVEGFDRYGNPGGNFFDISDQEKGAASVIALDNMVSRDVGRMAISATPGAIGDNTIANLVSSIQYKPTMDNGTSNFDDFYKTQVGTIGTVTQRAMRSADSQKSILEQLGNIRESISGVSLDEETTRMIEFQKGYEASARLIKVADEMFDTVLNLKRM